MFFGVWFEHKDLADRRMMNRRYFSPYDDFILNHYDDYQPSHHSSSNGAFNDIYGRMYSDRHHGELKLNEKFFAVMTNRNSAEILDFREC